MARARLTGRWRRIAIASVVSLAALGVIGASAYSLGRRHAEVAPDDWRSLLPTLSASPTPTPLPLTDVARDALSRVVTVEVVRDGAQALGTGWLLDDRGDFVTNAHVVTGERGVRLRDRQGHSHVGTLLGSDRDRDLAVIRSDDGFAGLPLPVETGVLTVPQDVVVVSASRATGHEDVITDRLSRVHVDVPVRGNSDIDPAIGATTVVYRDMLGLDGARIFAGNSGGPVLNSNGRVIGIVTLASRSAPQSYAIPMARVLDVLRSLSRASG